MGMNANRHAQYFAVRMLAGFHGVQHQKLWLQQLPWLMLVASKGKGNIRVALLDVATSCGERHRCTPHRSRRRTLRTEPGCLLGIVTNALLQCEGLLAAGHVLAVPAAVRAFHEMTKGPCGEGSKNGLSGTYILFPRVQAEGRSRDNNGHTGIHCYKQQQLFTDRIQTLFHAAVGLRLWHLTNLTTTSQKHNGQTLQR